MNSALYFYSEHAPGIQAPAFPGDAGYDLIASADTTIPAHAVCALQLDLFVAVPDEHVGMICGRSSMARRGIDVLGGVVDASYRGKVTVVLVNLTDRPCILDEGDRIAQLLIIPIATPELVRVSENGELGETVRSVSGFGSSGR